MDNPLAQSALADGEITRLIHSSYDGNKQATEQLMQLVYPQLYAIVKRQLRSEPDDMTQQPTDIVHDTYEKLEQQYTKPNNRRHFYAVVSRVSRQVIIDHIRKKKAAKRKGDRVDLEKHQPVSPAVNIDLLDLDNALQKLSALDPQAAKLMELRYFGGLTTAELAEYFDTSLSTVKRRWNFAKLNLLKILGNREP